MLSTSALIEPGIYSYLNRSLQECHLFRQKWYNIFLNLFLFFILILSLALILIYKYKGKMTPLEMDRRNKEKHQNILSQIQHMQEITKRVSQKSLITGLPTWNTGTSILPSYNRLTD